MKEQLNTESSKVSILVIDDDFQVSETIRDFLVSKGFDVETAHNGKQGICVLDLRIHSLRQRDRKAHDANHVAPSSPDRARPGSHRFWFSESD